MHQASVVLGSVSGRRLFHFPGDERRWRIMRNDGGIGVGSRSVTVQDESSGEVRYIPASRQVLLIDEPQFAYLKSTPYPWEQ